MEYTAFMDGIEADVVHFDIPRYFEVCRKLKPVSKLNPQITSDKDFAREIGKNMMIDDQVASDDQIFIGHTFCPFIDGQISRFAGQPSRRYSFLE